MEITVEISLYPLTDNYEQVVLDFIHSMHHYEGLRIETNGLSTQIFGEYDQVLDAIKTEMKELYQSQQAVLLIKMGRGTLTYKA